MRPVPNFHIRVSVSDLYIPTVGPPILLQQNMRTDYGYYINRSQIQECGKKGPTVSFLGIFVLIFRYSVFAV